MKQGYLFYKAVLLLSHGQVDPPPTKTVRFEMTKIKTDEQNNHPKEIRENK